MRFLPTLALLATILVSATASSQIGPSSYLQASDSPWSAFFGNGMFYLEDFEDRSLNTPGVTASAGAVIGPGGLTDSVDGDDGVLDNLGGQGRSWFTTNATNGFRFTFSSGTYGALPTHAGLVWTDGQVNGTTRFEAFDADGASLGILTGNHADGNFSGGTLEDRFYGWIHNGGISSIFITHSGGGGLEVDHLQYGAVPEPATMTALGLGIAVLVGRRRRRMA
ncbi:MAG: PEP-CTERM sorting domain-containing protein [Fimbriimonadaceae bacterium]|nr:PEP-CTERM sorting domain-containing protein [Fimbriimonadaceae bacterium]